MSDLYCHSCHTLSQINCDTDYHGDHRFYTGVPMGRHSCDKVASHVRDKSDNGSNYHFRNLQSGGYLQNRCDTVTRGDGGITARCISSLAGCDTDHTDRWVEDILPCQWGRYMGNNAGGVFCGGYADKWSITPDNGHYRK